MSNRVWVLVVVVVGVLIGGCAQPRPAPTPGVTVPPRTGEPSTAPSPRMGPTSSPMSSPASSPMDLSVEARDLSFTPRALVAPAGGTTQISIRNDGRVVHNLTIDELQLQLVASPGQTKTADLVDVPPGTYAYYCSVSGHRQAGMEGTLTVR